MSSKEKTESERSATSLPLAARRNNRLNEHLRQVYILNWAAIHFQSIGDNHASIFHMFMPLHINLCINLQFVYFIDFVFMLTLFGVLPAS